MITESDIAMKFYFGSCALWFTWTLLVSIQRERR